MCTNLSNILDETDSKKPNIIGQPSTDTYFEQVIEDPYRNLEDIEDTTLIAYVKKYNTYTDNKLAALQHSKRLIDYQHSFEEKKTASYKSITYINTTLVYLKRDADQNVYRLYYQNPTAAIQETLLFDPTTFVMDNQKEFKINYFRAAWDFSKVAISLSKNDNEFSKIVVLDVASTKVAPGYIKYCAPTLAGGIHWLPDNSGFLYTRFVDTVAAKEAYLNSKSVLYTLQQPYSQYQDVFSKGNNPELAINEEDFMVTKTTKDTDYVVGIAAGASAYDDAYYTPIDQIGVKNTWNPLFTASDKIKTYRILGDSLIYKTSKGAANFRICKTALQNPNFENPIVLVDEKKDAVLQEYRFVEDRLFYTTIKNGIEATMYTKNPAGEEVEISLPFAAGKIYFGDPNAHELPVILEGWTHPKTRYIYHTQTQKFALDTTYPALIDNSFDELVVEEVSVTSHDGEEIPLSLIYRKGLQKDGNTPVLMRAYGAYGVSMTPNFYYGFLLWAQQGGIYAVAHVRGGGEKGDAWHKAGYKETKPNSWKDLIACTEYLIDNQYTSTKKMAVWSGSAGGIVLGRAITERPDLFAAAIIDRGMFNTIRMDVGGNGANSAKEFGSIKDSIGFKALYEMDAYHHIKDNTAYPAVLITTGMNDTRLPPWQSIKFATRLKNTTTSDKPILLKTEFDSGHGMVFSKKDEEFAMVANVFSFAFWQTGHPEYQPEE